MTELSSYDFRGTGWAFPVTIDAGAIGAVSGDDDVRQSIQLILATAKGERVMRPDFGCGIHDLVFAAVSTQLITRLRREVEDALRTYEARIEVLRVAVGTRALDVGRLDVEIDYRVRATNQTGNYVYPFYFREA
ncbi:phage baseplate assembly protein W [Nocardioides sp. BE266]|uniref:GPW/gp25 family protein n=1 Tax=Nocardioides sp. BE266 TaxID=2817725 RepID=UPI00285E2CD4|nr:GPW/gp25 family protein [Nocardioides sp. BE266]MDR7254309.1 phage baseplate assembly protein W [Nocardioides sp. BE266]